MKILAIAPVLVLAASCGDDGGAASNPAVLWLAPFMSETEVQLQAAEPPPF